jgi:hypothetical protein
MQTASGDQYYLLFGVKHYTLTDRKMTGYLYIYIYLFI